MTQASCLVEPAEQQTGATHRMICPTPMTDDSSRRVTLEQLLDLPDAPERLLRLASLRHRPGGGSDRPGKMDAYISRLEHRDPVPDPGARLRPVALEDVQHARGEVRPTDGEGVLGWFSEADRLRLVLCRLGKSAKLGEAHDQPGATENRCRHGHPEILVDPLGGQRRKVVGGKLDHAFVFAPIVVRLLEITRGEDAKPQVSKALGDIQGASAG